MAKYSEDELRTRYGASEHGNFTVIDTIGVPHSYTIGARHVAYASDHFGGRLGEEAIERGERAGIKCQHRGCRLKYREHEQALLIDCKLDLEGQGEPGMELHVYLNKVKPLCEEDGYVGFAFKRSTT